MIVEFVAALHCGEDRVFLDYCVVMAGMCCGMGETEAAAPVEPSSKSARKRRMEIHQFNFVPSDSAVVLPLLNGSGKKKQKIEVVVQEKVKGNEFAGLCRETKLSAPSGSGTEPGLLLEFPKFGMTSVCGRRRDMEDSVAIHPYFALRNNDFPSGFHFFGVYDGHGCSHVSTKCKERMHEIVKAEIETGGVTPWDGTMSRSFLKMDKEVRDWCQASAAGASTSSCRCELQTPQRDAVGSTAVVAVLTPDKIVVSNCGDSRAVLCRNGVAIPLSTDHKPDRPDELKRIQESGGRVIFWDGPRVFGVLAMSRAIGDSYLKPYVISEPEVTVTERTAEDECLILASDGLWDVVSNDTACRVARICLQSRKPASSPSSPGHDITVTAAGESSDKACSDASILLTKLALARYSTDNVSVVVVDLRKGKSQCHRPLDN